MKQKIKQKSNSFYNTSATLRVDVGKRVSKVTIAVNVLLSALKVIVGIVGQSSALIADGIHSLSDVFSTIIVFIGIKLASTPEDKRHHYGHEKLEPVVSKILAIILLATGLVIGYNAVQLILQGTTIIPAEITIYVAILSIITKEWMYRYTIKWAEKIGSSALIADAWHHRSDALSSIATVVGIVGARLGFPMLDPIASLVICIWIIKAAVEIYLKAVNELIDRAADEEVVKCILQDILDTEGVMGVDDLKTRTYANQMYVDVEIAVDENLSVKEAHDIAEKVHEKIEKKYNAKHCMVHVNPGPIKN
jgi:cation diffusion facilitator family transporter